MDSLWPKIEKLLHLVEKPVRYIDDEWNSIKKPCQKGDILFALAYPDIYEIGMSSLAIHVLYDLLNNKMDGVVCERVFAPWSDMEALMRREDLPLFSLESALPVSSFDVVGFTLQHELTFTNVLSMLDLASIPLASIERNASYPLIIGGGPSAFNPEPLASFFDLFLLGDGEVALPEILEVIAKQKKKGWERGDLLVEFAKVKGVYVPSLYKVDRSEPGKISKIRPLAPGIFEQVERRWAPDLNKLDVPTEQVVPFTESIHDRCSIEIARGCGRGCRFCQAGIIYRPRRERSKELILSKMKELLRSTGYEEISLASLSSSDHRDIEEIVRFAAAELGSEKIAISLPSLRMDNFSVELAKEIQSIRKTGLTFAPEAGTQRLRNVINKNLSEEEILATAKAVFESGWEKIKLYFMIGLPTETMDDVEGIVDLSGKIYELGRKTLPRNKVGRLKINVSISSFVPKPHTPFQWAAQDDLLTIESKQEYLKKNLTQRAISLRWHDAKLTQLEGLLSRGDRRLSSVILRAYRAGARFDSWKEIFDFDRWDNALAEEGISLASYLSERELQEILPWQHLSTGVKTDFLIRELELAKEEKASPGCLGPGCTACGVCHSTLAKVAPESEGG
ncbi:MAG: TIGR03960 family B12-binding radical SAM protein [Actinomycetota bacterium]|nr:TIGR03960 family B12-binding radical SAM protein [Actinomycetota bacterium]